MKETIDENKNKPQSADPDCDAPIEALKAAAANDAKKENAKQANANKEDDDDEGPTLKEVIQKQAIEGEVPLSRTFSLRKILGGDILNTAAIRRQIWLFLLIAFFLVIYISNRYSCQQDIIEIDKLQTQLQDAKYRALSSTSQLTEKSRESNVLNMLKSTNDSTLKMPNQPPYIISIPENRKNE